MAKGELICGIDIGTVNVKAVLLELTDDISIVGVGKADSYGVRKNGEVKDASDLAKSIKEAVFDAALQNDDLMPSSLFVSAFGAGFLEGKKANGMIAVSNANQEINDAEISRLKQIVESTLSSSRRNKTIIEDIPLEYKVDNEKGIKDPMGMFGSKLELDSFLIEFSNYQMNQIMKALNEAEFDLSSFFAGPLMSALPVLTKEEKDMGVVVVDIGGGTTSFVVYEDDKIQHFSIIPVGSMYVTHDLAIGLQVDSKLAEKIKLNVNTLNHSSYGKSDTLRLSQLDESISKDQDTVILKRQVVNIMRPRYEEIFEIIDKEIKKYVKTHFLPGGVILVGGGSKINGILELAKEKLSLPAKLGKVSYPLKGALNIASDLIYLRALGTALEGYFRFYVEKDQSGFFGKTFKNLFKKFSRKAKDIMP